jgi:hypothetical protein
LTLDQLLVRPNGEILLVDPPLGETVPPEDPRPEDARALALLRQVVFLCLEGKEPAEESAPARVRVPLPLRAGTILKRLLQPETGYPSVQEFRSQLTATAGDLTSVTRMRRLALAMVQAGMFMGAGLAILISIGFLNRWARGENPFFVSRNSNAWEMIPMATVYWLLPLCSLLAAVIPRGGLSFPLCGLALVGADGRRATQWQAGGRWLLRWFEGGVILGSAPLGVYLLDDRLPKEVIWWSLGGWLVFVLIYSIIVLWLPRRGWIDRVVRTHVVPR